MRTVLPALVSGLLLLTGCGDAVVASGTVPARSSSAAVSIPPRLITPQPSGPGWETGPNDVVLRVDLHEGHGRSEIVSFTADGTVVRAADTSVYASVDGYTTWQISPSGLNRVQRGFDRLGVRTAAPGDLGDTSVSSSSRTVSLWFGDGRVVSGSAPLGGTGAPPAERLWALANEVVTPAWYGEDLVQDAEPWVPHEIGILAGPPDDTGRAPATHEPFRPWPLAEGIRGLSHRKQSDAYGEPKHALCVTGDDAAAVFELLGGENTAYLRVDDGQPWELNVMVHLPAYHLMSSPCAGYSQLSGR